MNWSELAASHARCSQFFLAIHHALLLPSIIAPAAVSLFGAASNALRYTVVGASAATALSLVLRLELRSYVHNKASREYMLLALDDRAGDVQRAAQLLREAPLLPCFCMSLPAGTWKGSGRDVPPAGNSEETRARHV